jgi:hypothetical protein
MHDLVIIEKTVKALLDSLEAEHQEHDIIQDLKKSLENSSRSTDQLFTILEQHFPGILLIASNSESILKIEHLKEGEYIYFTPLNLNTKKVSCIVNNPPKLTMVGWECSLTSENGDKFTIIHNNKYTPKIERDYSKETYIKSKFWKSVKTFFSPKKPSSKE